MIPQECNSTTFKTRSAAIGLIAELHVQLGPMLKALISQAIPDSMSSSVKDQIEKAFDTSPYEPEAAKVSRSKVCIVTSSRSSSETSSAIDIEIPKIDLVSSLPEGCLERMVRE